jgi:hypothetical protein
MEEVGAVALDSARPLPPVAPPALDQRVVEHRSLVVLACDYDDLVPDARKDDPLAVHLSSKAFLVDAGKGVAGAVHTPAPIAPTDDRDEFACLRVVRQRRQTRPAAAAVIRCSGRRRSTFGRVPTCSCGSSRPVRCERRLRRAWSRRRRGSGSSARADRATDMTALPALARAANPLGDRASPFQQERQSCQGCDRH